MWLLIIGAIAIVVVLAEKSGAVTMTTTNSGSGGSGASGACPGASCCGSITNDPNTWPTGDKIWDVARAIARAEGANIAGSVPDRSNNPGDLGRGDEHGQQTLGISSVHDTGEGIIIFATKVGGWSALYDKLQNIANGQSSVYSPDMTWSEFASKYAADPNWLANVTSILGVSPDSTFGAYVNGTCCAVAQCSGGYGGGCQCG